MAEHGRPDAFAPYRLALETQRQGIEAATEALETGEAAPEQLGRMLGVDVGQTPSEVVYTENKLELLHYESRTDEQHEVPILIVYALINKPYILDLQPDRSVVRRLLDAGHDVYMIDWNEPSKLDQHLTIDDYVSRYIDNCVDVVSERSGQDAINLLGYCMGGTMSAIYAAKYPEKVRNLGLMAAGLCFQGSGGVLELWGDEEYFSPDALTRSGNAPAELLDVGFALMDPVSNYVSKYVRLYDNLEDEDFVENFGRMERWLREGIDVAGDTFTEFIESFYQNNELYENEYVLGDTPIDVTEIDMPVLQITGEYDHLVPSEASLPFNDVIENDDVTTIEYPTGHIGLSVSSSTHEDVWPEVAEWYAERSQVEAEPEELQKADEADEVDEAEETEATTAENTTEQTDTESIEEYDGSTGNELEDAIESDATDTDSDATMEEPEDTGSDLEDAVEAEDESESETEDVGTGTEEGSSLEAISGIGPMYAGRLAEAGIETPEALAAADTGTVAEAAEVTDTRAGEWIERAK